MAVDVGAAKFRMVGLRLKVAGAGGLKLALQREIRAAVKPLIEDVRKAAEAEMPKAGGLNEWVAKGKFTTSVRFTGLQTGVRIKRSGQFSSDKHTFRHPVFGHRDRKWAVQPNDLRWFYATLEKRALVVATPRIMAALKETQTALMAPL
jgi:hypothetical protein